MTSPLRLLVRRVTWEAEGVLSFVLEDPDGRDLPPWAPGAHIDVLLPSGLVRQYSLCGDPAVRACYEIAVLLEKDSRGGSRELHHTQWVGKTLDVQGPRNHFELSPAKAYRLIAGGIGVTPILTMAAEIH
ncbi:MAG: ferredoxin reductase, partial [Hyphomonadaceae bacterium]